MKQIKLNFFRNLQHEENWYMVYNTYLIKIHKFYLEQFLVC
jgi:hypothetical protein